MKSIITNFKVSRLLLSVFLLTSIYTVGQDNLEKYSYEIQGELNCEIVYNQYFDTLVISDTLLSPWNFTFRMSYNPDKMYFVFSNDNYENDNLFDLLHIEKVPIEIKRKVSKDNIGCCIQRPLLTSSIEKRFQQIKSYNWNVLTEIVDDGCQDTHYSNLEIKHALGQVKFNNLNNISVYEIQYYKENSYLIVISTRLCRNQLIVFKISN